LNARDLIFKIIGDRKSIFSDNKNSSVSNLQLSLKSIPATGIDHQGVYVRFTIDSKIYTGLIACKDRNDIRIMQLTLPKLLQDEGAKGVFLTEFPFQHVTIGALSNFFSVRYSEKEQKITKKYWRVFKDDIEALQTYYTDLVNFRRELIFTQFPSLELEIPQWVEKNSVFVLYNEESRSVHVKFFNNTHSDKDEIIVQKTSEEVSFKNQEAFSKLFTLPPKENAISESSYYHQFGEKPYYNLPHPFLSVIEELKPQIQRFNSAQPRRFYNACNISPALVSNWTYQEIMTTRALLKKFPSIQGRLPYQWQKPIQVLIRYHLNDLSEGSVPDGKISAAFVNGPYDKILVEESRNISDLWVDYEQVVKKYFPEAKERPFYGFTSTLLTYIAEKLGEEY